MSDRTRFAVLSAWAALLCVPAAATAQATREELAARVDSLELAARTQHAEFEARDSARRARANALRTDTARVGPFLLVDRDTAPMSAMIAAVQEAWTMYVPIVGAGARRIEGTVVTSTLPESFRAATDTRVYRFRAWAWGGFDPDRAAHRVVTAVLTDLLPLDVRAWLSGDVMTLNPSHDWTYRALATAYSHSARACFDDDVDACVALLGLVDPGAAWERWYTHDELRAQVAARSRGPGAARACVALADHEACVHAARELGGAEAPLGGGSRAGLLAHALAMGGRGSYERLFADAPDAGSRIAHAAGAPLHDVIAAWRGELERARPSMHAGVIRAGFWTAMWLAALALLAMRSTRWRIG